MERLIFRNDDVNINTDKKKLSSLYGVIHSIFPDAEVWSCITLFAGRNTKQSVYGDLPLKNHDTNWFYKNADSFMYDYRHPMCKIASHGLFHIDHSKVSRETQEMSILSSCSFLKTNIFVPPFNSFNQDTIDICFDNEIKLASKGWKCLEFESFNPEQKLWYLHSWRWEPNQLKDCLNGILRNQNS